MKITVNNMDYEVKEVRCITTKGKSLYIYYYSDNDYMGKILYGSTPEIIKNKLERLSKKQIISNIKTAESPKYNNSNNILFEDFPF